MSSHALPARPKSRGDAGLATILLLPGLLVMLVVIVIPMLATIWQSLFGTPGLDPATGFVSEVEPFVGLGNFQAVFDPANHRFYQDLGNTTLLAFGTVIPETVIGMAMALLMNQALRARGLVRVSILVPWAIPSALSGVLWAWIFSVNGVVNELLPGQVLWTADGPQSVVAVMIADIWKTAPFLALLALAGLQTIPEEVYEAARVDGAGTVRQFFSITLPLVRPALVVAVLFRLLDALRMFDLPYVLIGPRKGSVETLSMLSQDEAASLRFGSAAAYAIVLFAYIFLIAFVFIRFLGADIVGAGHPERASRRQERRARMVAAAGGGR
jgi:multiple sugar transport system permease protein